MQIGTATYGRRRPVVLTPKPSRCRVCGTDNEMSPCPQNCPTRKETRDGNRR